MDATSHWDAIVVGSGVTGGWAAKELTERGLRVLMIERGRDVEHAKDYVTEHLPPWKFAFRGRGNPKTIREDYPIQSLAPGVSEDTWHFFVKDSEHPYLQEEGTEFAWIRGYQVGGRSLTWGRQTYRWSELDFEANAADGHGVDWPIRYEDVAPWYDHVESFIGVSGQAEGLPQLPDGPFLPPMEMTCAEVHFKQAVEAKWPERRVTMGRTATLTVDHGGRKACHYCGPCGRGCSTGSYFSTQSSTLPAARATGRLELLTDTFVEKVGYDAARGRATGVAVVDPKTGERRDLSARLVFLCASTIPTTRILLASASEAFPDGLANRSGVLGRYLMDHTIGLGAFGIFPQFAGQQVLGERPNNIYIPRFQNVGDRHPDFVRGYGFQCAGLPLGWSSANDVPGFGAAWKDAFAGPLPWILFLAGFGECLPRAENRVTLDPKARDARGIPRVRVAFRWSDNERAMRKDVVVQATAMLEAAGAANIVPSQGFGIGGEAIHEMGTARMGRDPATSVLNAHNQAHDVPNLFVTDGSCMTSSACQNPSLTYMALTARAAAYAVGEMQKGAL
jgi:choline dehydrogenase-like flavoprotein